MYSSWISIQFYLVLQVAYTLNNPNRERIKIMHSSECPAMKTNHDPIYCCAKDNPQINPLFAHVIILTSHFCLVINLPQQWFTTHFMSFKSL